MTDPRTAPQQGQPSEEEMRAYLEAVRQADVTELVAQAYSLLGTGAEVKLGRADARPLIDGLAGLVEATAPALPGDLVERMRQQIGQLQVAQVQLEEQARAGGDDRETASQPGGGQPAGGSEQADSSASGGQGRGPGAGQAGQEQKMTDRLWVPGRDAPPPAG